MYKGGCLIDHYYLFVPMIQRVELVLTPAEAAEETFVHQQVLQELHLEEADRLQAVLPIRRSIDARSKQPVVRLLVEAYIDEPYTPPPAILQSYGQVASASPVIVVGAALRVILPRYS